MTPRHEKKQLAESLIRQRANLKKQLADCEMNLDLLALSTVSGAKKKAATFRVVAKKNARKSVGRQPIDDSVRELIKQDIKSGRMTQAAIAKRHGVSQGVVSRIKTKELGMKPMTTKDKVEAMTRGRQSRPAAVRPECTKCGRTFKGQVGLNTHWCKPKTAAKANKKEPATHMTLRMVKEALLAQPDADHDFNSIFADYIGKDNEKTLRANFSKAVGYAVKEGAVLRIKARPLTIRKRNIKKIRSLNKKGFNAHALASKKK